MSIQVKVGDVFLINFDKYSSAIGQVVGSWNDELYVAIFSKIEVEDFDIDDVMKGDPVLLALTLDAKFFNGDWKIISNIQDNLSRIPQAVFKVRQSGVVYLESRDRTISRPASPSEAQILIYRSVVSPAILENATRAFFGLGEWSNHYDDLLSDYAFQSAGLIKS